MSPSVRIAFAALLLALPIVTGCYADDCERRYTCRTAVVTGFRTNDEDRANHVDDDEAAVQPGDGATSESNGDSPKPQTGTSAPSLDALFPTRCSRDKRVVEDGCGVFVSAMLGDDTNVGDAQTPVRTLQHALTLAKERRGVVYACAEVFHESVWLPPEITLIGGLNCASAWIATSPFERTEIVAPPEQVALIAAPGDEASLVIRVRMRAVDAVLPSGSSIAAITFDGSKVAFEDCDFMAGNARDGANGAPFPASAQTATDGPNGFEGDDACTSTTPLGGALNVAVCDDGSASAGGAGGKGGLGDGFDGTSGLPNATSNIGASGAAGAGESGIALCTHGAEGADGENGADGDGASGFGVVSTLGYIGKNGSDGHHGVPGQGGGGGGGSRGGMLLCGGIVKGGAGGGSGGAGGCSGAGGKGGAFGGASIGLVVGDAEVSVKRGIFITGNGGNGGAGGLFQLGGQGGAEGVGGAAHGPAHAGCNGGKGGRGGNGGYGGGGLGGPSVAVTHKVDEPDIEFALTLLGKPGSGGAGNPTDSTGSQGANGASGELVPFPQPP